MTQEDAAGSDIVGVIPAAGKGSRLGRLPCSKEILPLAAGHDPDGEPRVFVLSDCLLAEFKRANIADIAIATAPQKRDIPAYFSDGERFGARITYSYLTSPNTPASILAAIEDYASHNVALGFPDILYGNDNAFSTMLRELERSAADVVLGLYPTEHPELVDMVRCDAVGVVTGLRIKQGKTDPNYTHCWLSAVWRPTFSEFLQNSLADMSLAAEAGGRELYVGDFFIDAIKTGLEVRAVTVANKACLDAGTPATYAQALKRGYPPS